MNMLKIEAFLREPKTSHYVPWIGAILLLLLVGLLFLFSDGECKLLFQILPFVGAIFGAVSFSFLSRLFLLWRGDESLFLKIKSTIGVLIAFGGICFFLLIMTIFSTDAC